jgi:hypothetical protein
MNYNSIYHPKSNQYISTQSNLGKKLIKNYLKSLLAGADKLTDSEKSELIDYGLATAAATGTTGALAAGVSITNSVPVATAAMNAAHSATAGTAAYNAIVGQAALTGIGIGAGSTIGLAVLLWYLTKNRINHMLKIGDIHVVNGNFFGNEPIEKLKKEVNAGLTERLVKRVTVPDNVETRPGFDYSSWQVYTNREGSKVVYRSQDAATTATTANNGSSSPPPEFAGTAEVDINGQKKTVPIPYGRSSYFYVQERTDLRDHNDGLKFYWYDWGDAAAKLTNESNFVYLCYARVSRPCPGNSLTGFVGYGLLKHNSLKSLKKGDELQSNFLNRNKLKSDRLGEGHKTKEEKKKEAEEAWHNWMNDNFLTHYECLNLLTQNGDNGEATFYVIRRNQGESWFFVDGEARSAVAEVKLSVLTDRWTYYKEIRKQVIENATSFHNDQNLKFFRTIKKLHPDGNNMLKQELNKTVKLIQSLSDESESSSTSTTAPARPAAAQYSTIYF